MIQPVGNFNINFKGTPERAQDDDLGFREINKMFAARDRERQAQRTAVKSAQTNPTRVQKSQPKTTHKRDDRNNIRVISRTDEGDIIEFSTRSRAPQSRKKGKGNIILRAAIPSTIALGTLLAILNPLTDKPNEPTGAETTSSQIYTTSAPVEVSEEELISQAQQQVRKQEVKEAVDNIKKDPELSLHYYNMITTLQRMDNLLGDSTSVLEQILSEPWAQGTDIELLLPQIFYESSGLHYDENGTINTSSANCVGLMQISEDAQIDVNKRYFSDMPLDRQNPVDNIKLGIGLNQLLSEEYFGDDIFSVLCSYNAGAGNILKGNYLGSDIYANNILTCAKALKEHPEYTQMLLSGELDEYKDELLA